MNTFRKPGISRRPIEYLLMFTIVLLILILLWAVRSLQKQQPTSLDKTPDAPVEVRDGTLREIGRLADEDTDNEEALIKGADEDERQAASADAAADNVGGIYDETTY